MDRRGHGPFHIGEGQPLIGDGAGGELWRTSGKAAHGYRRLTLGAAPNEAIRVYTLLDVNLVEPKRQTDGGTPHGLANANSH
jgi:hypothetical protein